MKVTKDTVKYVAQLARVKLEPKEIESLTKDLDGILGYIDKLNSLDTKETQPSSHVQYLKNVFRKDEISPSLPLDKVFSNAPEKQDSFFKVPQVIN